MSKRQRVECSGASETPGIPVEKFGSDDVRPDFGCNEWFLGHCETLTLKASLTLLPAKVVQLSKSLVNPGR
jgi:hypothetical protein